MATVTMPQLGESVTEGIILKWLKQTGDSVALDDSLCEIETEKVTAELPSPFEGTMGAIHVPEGETVEVGAPLCDVVEGAIPGGAGIPVPGDGKWSGGPMAIPPDETAPTFIVTPPPPAVVGTSAANAPRRPEARERFYSPAVLRLAGEHKVDLASLFGSGIGGRVTRRDVERAIAAPLPVVSVVSPLPGATAARVSPEAFEVITFSATRRAIATNLQRSNTEAPQAWTMVEADVTGLAALRARDREALIRAGILASDFTPKRVVKFCLDRRPLQ